MSVQTFFSANVRLISYRLFVLFVTSLAVLLSAASCSLIPGQNNREDVTLGLLKKDPSIRETFGRINTVETLSGDKDSDGLLGANVVEIVSESENNLFVLTESRGLFKTENGGQFWDRRYIFAVGSDGGDSDTRNVEINDQIARNNTIVGTDFEISPTNPNLLFVAGSIDDVGKIWRSEDNGETFREVYSEIEKGNNVISVAVDGRDSTKIYALLEGGVVLRSNDSGATWRKIREFNTQAVQLGVVPEFNNVLFVLLQKKGYWFSLDNGDSWNEVPLSREDSAIGERQTNDFTIRSDIFDQDDFGKFERLIPVTKERNSWVLLADRQIWYTDNLARPFIKLVLPLTDEKYKVASVAIDPVRGVDRLLVSIDDNLFETNNRGQSWSTNDSIGLSSEIGNINDIVIEDNNPNIIYLGLTE